MRLAVLADIHGNAAALEAVLADAERQRVDGVVAAGDYLAHGPRPLEVLHLLRSKDCHAIRGNTESRILAHKEGDVPASWQEGEQWAAQRWTSARLDDEAEAYLASLPEQSGIALPGALSLRLVHGSHRRDNEFLCPDNERQKGVFRETFGWDGSWQPVPLPEVMAEIAEPMLVCGHSHIPWVEERDGWLALNPGSVGQPLDGDVRAQYALLNWAGNRWQAELRKVAYDLSRTRQDFEESGYLEGGGAFARACLLGMTTGRNVPWFLVSHACHLAEAEGHSTHAIPEAIWQRAAASFAWDDWA